MTAIETHIKRVHEKLQLVLTKYNKLQIENEQHKKTIASLQLNDDNQKTIIVDLEEKLLLIKAQLAVLDDTEKKILEKKINTYIKNIDSCISLLSHKNDE